MVVFFRKMNTLFIILGIALAAVIGLIIFQGRILVSGDIPRLFFFVLLLVAGLIAGRLLAACTANDRLRKIYAILYSESDPKRFIEEYEPLLSNVPKDLAEYMDGCCHLSFAREALGEFDEAYGLIKDLDPDSLKLHALSAASRITNQKANVCILKGERDEARALIDYLGILREAAQKRAPMLAQNLSECINLHTARLSALENDPRTDTDYLEDEITRSTNLIHKKEIELELAGFLLRQGKWDAARGLLEDILATEHGLYTEKKARELLSDF